MSNTFVDGLIVKQPHPKAPSFVKAALSVKVAEFAKFAMEHEQNGWLNIDIKESKEGKLYASLNVFKKKSAPEVEGLDLDDISAEDLPF